jgi:16S rRNA (guanine527-N7)-methyltransferase
VIERAPLPVDPEALPALGPEFHAIVAAGCRELGITLTAGQLAAIDAHARLLLAWNAHINLTALRTEEQVARLHVLDSLTAVPLLRGRLAWQGERASQGEVAAHGAHAAPSTPRPARRSQSEPPRPSLLDLGSGGGYPGLPLGVALPASRVALVDSVGKKARFLEVAAAASMERLDAGVIPTLTALRARAEDLARDREHREAWDVVTARAVGSLAELVELGLPLLRVGGSLIAWKRDDGSGSFATELTEAAALTRAAGGSTAQVHAATLSGLAEHRLVEVRKIQPTPGRFPRSPAERRRP